jgi:hypothetical protein
LSSHDACCSTLVWHHYPNVPWRTQTTYFGLENLIGTPFLGSDSQTYGFDHHQNDMSIQMVPRSFEWGYQEN